MSRSQAACFWCPDPLHNHEASLRRTIRLALRAECSTCGASIGTPCAGLRFEAIHAARLRAALACTCPHPQANHSPVGCLVVGCGCVGVEAST